MIDEFNGMSTHLGHVMPKRNMSNTIEKIRQKYTICRSESKNRFKVCIGDLTGSDVLI